MNKTELTSLLHKQEYSSDDLRMLDKIVEKYPWFELGRFVRLKAMRQLGVETFDAELTKSVIFTSDRKRLHQWLSDQKEDIGGHVFMGTELEFIDSQDDADQQGQEQDDIESVLGSDETSDADKSVIKEKDETDMEEPEIDASEDQGLIDPMADKINESKDLEEDKLDDHSEEDIEKTSSRDDVHGNAKSPVENEGEDNADASEQKDHVQTMNAGGDDLAGENSGIEGHVEIENILPDTDIGDPEKSPENEDDKSKQSANPSMKLIHEFLQTSPGVIKADKKTSIEGDISKDSVKEKDSNISDTLAKIYVKQGLHAKAIYAYERLSLKYPEKSAYFAAQIEKIKSISNL